MPEQATWTAIDRLLLCTLAALAMVTVTFHPSPLRLLLVFGALALFVWVTAKLERRTRLGDAIHAFAPLVVIVSIFETVGFLIGVTNPARWDVYFADVDARHFGALVPAWRNLLGRPASILAREAEARRSRSGPRADQARSSERISSAEANRAAGSFSRSRSAMQARSGSAPGFTRRVGAGRTWRICRHRSTGSVAAQGGVPVTSS